MVDILVIEDEGLIREVILDILKHFHDEEINVHDAASLREAISLINLKIPDIIILDMMLPDSKDLSILRVIREWCPHPKTQIIVCTAYSTDILKHKIDLKDTNYYIAKPFDHNELLTLIKQAIIQVHLRN